MRKAGTSSLPIAGEQRARIDRDICPRALCGNGFLQWMSCRHPECPSSAELIDRATKKEKDANA